MTIPESTTLLFVSDCRISPMSAEPKARPLEAIVDGNWLCRRTGYFDGTGYDPFSWDRAFATAAFISAATQ